MDTFNVYINSNPGDMQMGQKIPQAEERAFQTLFELIRTHKIRPGERIYETDLAERFGMSRTPLRAALMRLVTEGVLSKSPGRRGYALPHLTGRDMKEVFFARAALEGMAGLLLARGCSDEAAAELDGIILRQKELLRTGVKMGEYASLNGHFHFALIEHAGNEYIERCFSPIYWRSIMYTLLYATFYTGNEAEALHHPRRPSWEQHKEILEAIKSGDGENARRIIEAHVLENCSYWREGIGQE
jgi:GntR family transcriptional regulator of vanillate catabolism